MNRPALNYLGSDWALLSVWLEEELQTTYQRLANPRTTEVETHQLRGRAMFIAQLLGFKEAHAAQVAANRE